MFRRVIGYADVAELADALDSGSSGSNTVWVQVPSSAPEKARFGVLFLMTRWSESVGGNRFAGTAGSGAD